MEKIDFVLTWVDGNDPEWLAEKRKWEALSRGKMSDKSEPMQNAGIDPMTNRCAFGSVL